MTEVLHTASGDAAPGGAYQTTDAPTPSPWSDDGPTAFPTNTSNNWTGLSHGWGSPIQQDTTATQPTTSLWGNTSDVIQRPQASGDAGDDDGWDSGTDSDTISSDGREDLDYSDITNLADENEAAEQLFWLMQHAKRRWRRFMKKNLLDASDDASADTFTVKARVKAAGDASVAAGSHLTYPNCRTTT